MNDISISVVSHNDCDNVRILLQNLTEHTKGISYHVYVVDNGEPDYSTASVLKNEFIDNENITFLTCKNNGFGAGHNSVMNLIDSEYHAIINPDIRIETNVLPELTEYLKNHPETALVTPQIRNADGSEQFLPRRTPNFRYLVLGRLSEKVKAFQKYRDEYTMRGIDCSSPVKIEFCTGCFMVTKTAFFKGVGGFDDKYFMYFEDVDLTERMQEFGNTMLIHDSYVIHDWHGGSRGNKQLMKIHIKSMFRYFLDRPRVRRQLKKKLAKKAGTKV
ncbi:MAG: glycosyltransferase family 2 protein [Clostridia bacterium]|nr:glycosyltransferase family 2 protein [Clostridia bacterium]